jgi:hypothetical protein
MLKMKGLMGMSLKKENPKEKNLFGAISVV